MRIYIMAIPTQDRIGQVMEFDLFTGSASCDLGRRPLKIGTYLKWKRPIKRDV